MGRVRHRGAGLRRRATSSRPTRACSAAIDCARDTGPWDAFVAVGRRLEHRHRQGDQPADDQPRRADGLRQRAGRRRPGPGQPAASRWSPSPPRPAPASESTTICVLDVLALKVKTGHQPRPAAPRRSPSSTPSLTLTQPAGRHRRGGHGHPLPRAGELHRAPVHDLRAQAARAAGALLRRQPDRGHVVGEGDEPARRSPSARAVRDGDDERGPRRRWRWPRPSPAWASATPGVHIPHANAYPIAGRVKDFHPEDYPADEPMVPHGMSVALTAPEAFRFTFDAVAGAAPARRPAARPGGRASRTTPPSSCRRCSSP